MALSLEDLDEITKRNPHKGKGDQINLSDADESVLNKAWSEVADEKELKRSKKTPAQAV